MEYKLVKQIRANDILRQSFIKLAEKTFGLSFQNWYENGFWTEKYIPYTIVKDGKKVVANVSVNIIDTEWENMSKRYIQLGTIMTDPEYRNRGFSSQLIKVILSEWEDKCDAVYLFANSTVLDFYPKFGFVKAVEYQCKMPFYEMKGDFRKLNISVEKDNEILKKCYRKSNPFSILPMKNNYGLLMFYCSSFMKDSIYYSKKYDIVCIAEKEENTLICFDIFGNNICSMEEVIFSIPLKNIKEVTLGFTPKNREKYFSSQIINEDTLFVLKGKENIFKNNKIMFPLLSHA
ncbi:GNAT family N-acetyltransferase [Fusobacterium ulcerans]|uniref:GNAT family N-acetyltransferase n=1 Tax=Fusobacterium ulcerans TaxID=861 RepID=UPI001032D5CC|nr:GNAT family N-acetyltransferase [Fusobacterium ulcerans]